MITLCKWCIREGRVLEPAGKVSHSIGPLHTMELVRGMRAAVAAEAAASAQCDQAMNERAARLLKEAGR